MTEIEKLIDEENAIRKGDLVSTTNLCMTPELRGKVGKVIRIPRKGYYIVKFTRDSNFYIFGEQEVIKQ